MATIKTIAEQANVSPSTVSIILNGKADERKISEKTRKRVEQIIVQTGYRPNVQAIGLRTLSHRPQYQIAILWVADSRAQSMLRVFQSIEAQVQGRQLPCEILLKSYRPGRLQDAMSEDFIRSCHGILICNATEKDLIFLESRDFSRPVVLYNRYSKKYCTVTMDDKAVGAIPAGILADHHKKRAAVIASAPTFNGMLLRTNLFSYICQERGMEIPLICYDDNSEQGGYAATARILSEHPDIDCLFYASDLQALGALRFFHEQEISVPGLLEFIAVGTSQLERCAFSCPSISVVYLPIEEVAAKCMELLYQLITYQKTDIEAICVPVHYIARESCPG